MLVSCGELLSGFVYTGPFGPILSFVWTSK